jgi:nickel/cobalt exporter
MRRLVICAVLAIALVAPAAAAAHPLGNFTINRFSRVQLSGDRAYVRYVLDMAEIPTYQARSTVRRLGEEGYTARLGDRLRRHLSLTVGGRSVALRELRHAIAFPHGQAGLHTTRLEAVFGSGPVRGGDLRYADGNYAGRIGWKEIVVAAGAGARLRSSSAPTHSISDELRAYPKDLLQSPLDVTTADAAFTPGSGPGVPPAIASRRALDSRVAVRDVGDGGFAALIGRDRLPAGVVLLSLLLAMFWGAAHALSPGHGKSVVAAYLVGTRGTRRDAVVLGVTVTVTHTIGVFALGLITLSLSQFILPEHLYPWLNLASALLVLVVGFAVLRRRLRASGHSHPHTHTHHHHHSTRGLLGIGISSGLLPCPTALVVLLAAISLHRVGYGLVLILAFSVGLAGAMTGIGMLAVSAKRVFDRVDMDGSVVRLLPAVSTLAIIAVGLTMLVRAVPGVT